MGYLTANLYPLLLLGVILGAVIGWMACDPKNENQKGSEL